MTQYAFRREGTTYRVGFVRREDNRFVEIATVLEQHWANQITLALNMRADVLNGRKVTGPFGEEVHA